MKNLGRSLVYHLDKSTQDQWPRQSLLCLEHAGNGVGRPERWLMGCESSGVMRRAFRTLGHEAWSCDLLPAADGSPFHIQGDVLDHLDDGWDGAIFHPDCTYLTNSAAWAFSDPDYDRYPGVGYHQRIKPGTLTGFARRLARDEAVVFALRCWRANIGKIALENPVGYLSRVLGAPAQIIQPNWFGNDASKGTCLWLKDLPPLTPTELIAPRMVNGKPRWANQTDSGQNRLSPSDDRWQQRAETYPGIAQACAQQWTREPAQSSLFDVAAE